MNLINPFRAELSGVSSWINEALDQVLAKINALWNVEHDEDGHHTDITCDTLTIHGIDDATLAGSPFVGSPDGIDPATITGDLIPPADNTYKLGAVYFNTAHSQLLRQWAYVTTSTLGIGKITGALGQSDAWFVSVSSGNATMFAAQGGTSWTFKDSSLTTMLSIGSSGITAPGVVSTASISATGTLTGSSLIITDGISAPSATSGKAKIYVDTADGDLKVIFGDGVIKTIVVDT